jgi:hypothetical protein
MEVICLGAAVTFKSWDLIGNLRSFSLFLKGDCGTSSLSDDEESSFVLPCAPNKLPCHRPRAPNHGLESPKGSQIKHVFFIN